MKPGRSKKFHFPWSGPFKITAKISDLNYEILDHGNRKRIVHVNRLKGAHCSDTREAKPSRKRESTRRNVPTRTEREEEGEGEIRIGPFPLRQPAQQEDELEPEIPPNQILDTPGTNDQRVDTPYSEHRDPTYSPATTPRSRRALQPTREEPPLTRLRARVTPQDNVTQCEND